MDVQKKELKNGLVVLSEVMPHLRSVSLGVWVKCGSRCEDAKSNGIAHFIEHLLFKGTTSRSTEEIAETIDAVGGQLNAFTEKEYIGFYARVLDEHLPLAFDLLSDIVLHPAFPAKEVERERNVIFEEISMVEDSPQELILDMYMERCWKGHPLGLPIAGTKESVGGISRNDVKKFFRRYFTAGNMVLSAAGNIDHRKIQRLAEKYFAKLETGVPAAAGEPPVFQSGRLVRRKPHLEQTHVCLGTIAPPMASDERYCAHLLSSILGGGMSSRLFQNIREKKGLVYSIYSMLTPCHDAGTLTVYAGSAPETAAQVVELTLKEFGKMRRELVSREELKRAKECIKGAMTLGLESSSSRMTNLAQQMIYHGRLYELEESLAAVERVTAREIRELAVRILDPKYFVLTALGGNGGTDLKSVPLELGDV
ncbi:MAG: insulinase family protein [Acidobacteriota bacterium]|jgi:predicted Zn-dependent peptidase|nr:insulinase family protein [Acidobacteriota bacterium]